MDPAVLGGVPIVGGERVKILRDDVGVKARLGILGGVVRRKPVKPESLVPEGYRGVPSVVPRNESMVKSDIFCLNASRAASVKPQSR